MPEIQSKPLTQSLVSHLKEFFLSFFLPKNLLPNLICKVQRLVGFLSGFCGNATWTETESETLTASATATATVSGLINRLGIIYDGACSASCFDVLAMHGYFFLWPAPMTYARYAHRETETLFDLAFSGEAQPTKTQETANNERQPGEANCKRPWPGSVGNYDPHKKL